MTVEIKSTYLMEISPELKTKINTNKCHVSIFGSARIKENDELHHLVMDLSYKLAKSGFNLITGGGHGLMEAASAGHSLGKIAEDDNLYNIGLNIKLPFEQTESKHLDIKKEFFRFSERLEHFMIISDAVIVAPGGIGTILELFYTWQLIQVKHIKSIPMILFSPDERWEKMIVWLKDWILNFGLMDNTDFSSVYIGKTAKEVISILNSFNFNKVS